MTDSSIGRRPYRRSSDFSPVYAMWTRTFQETWPLPAEELARLLDEQDRTHRGRVEVATRGDAVIGLIATQRHCHRPAEASLVLLLVDEAHRRRGVGRGLVAGALQALAGDGVATVELGAWASPLFWHGVPADLAPARRFFEKQGWRWYEESADLLCSLATFTAPPEIMSRVRAAGVTMRPPAAAEVERVFRFVEAEFPGFTDYYVWEVQRSGTANLLLAVLGDDIVASIILTVFPRCSGAHWASLLGRAFGVTGAAVVHRDHRRAGIGVALTAAAWEVLKERGCELCYLHWTWMVDLYAKLGAVLWRRYLMGRLCLTEGAGPAAPRAGAAASTH